MSVQDLLSAFHGLPHKSDQSIQANFLKFLELFTDPLINEDATEVCERLKMFISKGRIVPYPEYGCVILVNETTGNYRSSTYCLLLLGLDEWKFHLNPSKSDAQYVSYPYGYRPIYSGSIPAQKWKSCLRHVNKSISKAEEAHGNDRSAGFNAKGHQKTPAFIASVFQDAVQSIFTRKNVMSNPRGGFTDVGLHTGGAARDTDWPLARITVEWFFHQFHENGNPDFSFSQTLMRLYLSLTEKYINEVQSDMTVVNIDVIMKMLTHMVSTIMPYIDRGYNVKSYANSIAMYRTRLDTLVTSKYKAISSKFILPNLPTQLMPGDHLYDVNMYELPTMKLPVCIDFSMIKADLAQTQKLAQSNLAPLVIMQINDNNTHSALLMEKWLIRIEKSTHNTRLISMHIQRVKLFEYWIFTQARNLESRDLLLGKISTIQSLERCVELYRNSVKAIVDHLSHKTTHVVEMLSKETLVVWIVYCMIDYSTRHIHPTLQKYGVSLKYEQLMHLVLSDKLALDALVSVAKYVHKHSKNPVFSLRDNDQTINTSVSLAVVFALQDSTLMDIWKSEQDEASNRVEAHWTEVQRKQALARKLRIERDELQVKYDQAERECNDASKEYERNLESYKLNRRLNNHPSDVKKTAAFNAKTAAHKKLTAKINEFAEAEKAPDEVIQPLPSEEIKALSVLFFLFMPPAFRSLSRFSFMAQQMMMPRYKYAHTIAEVALTEYTWQFDYHFNTYRGVKQYVYATPRTGSLEDVLLGSRTDITKVCTYLPAHVDNCINKSIGIWYPNNVHIELGWNGGRFSLDQRGALFNPFVSITEHSTTFYTAKASETCESLQPAFIQESEPQKNRGNLGLTQYHTRPSTMSKNQFISFYDIRSYPYTQIREITRTLHEKSLSIDCPNVKSLITMTLYQVGELKIKDDNIIQQLWKLDITTGDGMMAIYNELVKLIDEISEKPRDYQSLPLLIDLITYLCHGWKVDTDITLFVELRDKCVDIITKWATDLNPQIETVLCHKEKTALQANQGLFYLYGILAYDGSYTLSSDAIKSLCIIHVMFRQSLKYTTNVSMNDCSQYMYRYESIIATRIHEILKVIQKDISILTSCIKAVLTSSPNALIWAATSYSITCYEAIDSNDNLYSINLLNGIILLNGSPPSSLPEPILTHPLYRRVFGDRNFEIVTTAEKTSRTCKPLQGHYYEFYLHADNTLNIWEIPESAYDTDNSDDGKNHILELLDYEHEWCQQLPPRLCQLHSHWYCRALNIIIFRPIHFLDTDISYLGLIQTENHISSKSITDESMTYKYKLYRIATHQQKQLWDDLHQKLIYDSLDNTFLGPLVLYPEKDKQPELLRILSKFESLKYMHTYEHQLQDDTMQIIIELPRFGLELVIYRGSITLPDFTEYTLAKCQQFDDTLTTFSGYLILQHVSNPSDTRVIVPNGTVMLHPDTHKVTMQASDSCDAKRSYHVFYTHHRTHYLCASTIPDRLLLAALYTATGTYLPERRTKMTGGEYAMYLVRRCMTDQPLDDYTHLGSILQYAWREPALYILASDLVRSSTQLSFLYSPTTALYSDDDMEDYKDDDTESDSESDTEDSTDNDRGDNDVKSDLKVKIESVLPLPLFEDRLGEYLNNVSNHICNYRNILTIEEESRIPGFKSTRKRPDYARDYSLIKHQVLPDIDIDLDHVATVQNDLISLVEEVKSVDDGSKDSNTKPSTSHGHTSCTHSHSRPLILSSRSNADNVSHNSSHTQESFLALEMKKSLSDSYDIHTQLGEDTIKASYMEKRHFYEYISSRLDKTKEYRKRLEKYLLDVFHESSWMSERTLQHKLMIVSNQSTIPTILDLVEYINHDRLRQHVSVYGGLYLSEEDLVQLRRRVLYWLELCVLEDTLTRLSKLTTIDFDIDTWKYDTMPINLARILKEIQSVQVWNVHECPLWLAFEWDGNLQIRPAQYVIAKNLIENPGTIMQLNMGEGKTRVILPMLILYYRYISITKEMSVDTPIIRINMLTQLIREGYEYMHHILTAGILNIPLYNMPFQRSVELTEKRVHLMREHVLQCRQLGGAIFVAPEHRCSLYLNKQMLGMDEECIDTYTALKVYEALPFKDIIDESDEVLKHKYQLVYATGDQQTLSSLTERTAVIQALLEALMANKEIKKLTSYTSIFDCTSTSDVLGCFYSNIRLLTFDCPDLITSLIDSILNKPPYDMTWLTKFVQKYDRNTLVQYIMNVKESADTILPPSCFEEIYHQEQLLALRGLLGHGVFIHCIQKRHRVYYGLAPELNKLIAVPFQACDVPSLRSEFAHPDTALLFTFLSYLYEGLSQEQMITTFKTLLKQGPNVQTVHYTQWYETSTPNLDTKTARQIDSIDKIDLSNMRQVTLLYSTYNKNFYMICYWLRNCMLPHEMKQFTHSLKATAYHLAATHEPIGFSGTNDLHVLLPAQVRQCDYFKTVADEKSLIITKPIQEILATNGRMLDIILKYGTYTTLETPDDATTIKPWERLIDRAFELGMSALIDAGALLAGVDCMELATYITTLIKQDTHKNSTSTTTSTTTNHLKFKAVVYHDGTQWVVQNHEKRKWLLASSPIRECDTFVVFGERHSRGADMKLKSNAQALLTLGPNMCKDKLMQACGRMRQLGAGQKVTFISSYDVHASITSLMPSTAVSSSKVQHVNILEYMLEWILNNTIKTATSGLAEWAFNGLHFSKTYNETKDVQIVNETTVYGMYEHANIDTTVKDAIHQKVKDLSSYIPSLIGVVEVVMERTDRYGSELSMVYSQASEEHECEKEQEEQQEYEREVEKSEALPYAEVPWNYSVVIQNDFKALTQSVSLFQLSSIISSKLSINNRSSIVWNKQVYVTTNFIQSITNTSVKLDQYLRRVNHLLLIEDYIVLLSPMESNGILSYMWNNPLACANTGIRILPLYILNNVCLKATDDVNNSMPVRLCLPDVFNISTSRMNTRASSKMTPSWKNNKPLASMLTSIKLFDGHTTFGPRMYPILQTCVSTKLARAAVMEFPKMHGLSHMIEQSELEKACETQGKSQH